MPPARKPFWRDLALQIALLLATLGATEVILRAIDLRYLRMHESGVAPVYAHHAELGWYPIPNSEQKYSGAGTVHVRHNSLGLRDIELEDAKKPTIAFVGDSFVWGYDSEEDDRFTNVLRRKLPDHRVVNVGVTAYGTDQQYLLLRRLWDRIQPKIVVLIVCVDNDHIENSTNLRYDGPYKPFFDPATGQFAGQPVPWSRHLYYGHYAAARHSFLVRTAIAAFVYARHPPIHLSDPTERLILMMRDLAQSRGAKFLTGLQKSDARYETFLRAHKIPFVAFDGADTYPTHGNHWTQQGNMFVADKLATFLAEQGALAQ